MTKSDYKENLKDTNQKEQYIYVQSVKLMIELNMGPNMGSIFGRSNALLGLL